MSSIENPRNLRVYNSTLTRKTPLRRSGKIQPKPRKQPHDPELSALRFREFAWSRSKGFCECGCGQAFLTRRGIRVVGHHVFYKSHADTRIRDEFWNGALILDACHRAVHDQGDRERRSRMEEKAVERLKEDLTARGALAAVQALQRGTSPASFVRAYEAWRRTNP